MTRYTETDSGSGSDAERIPIKASRPPPAPRPPKAIRERFLHTLPPYTGPYQVGFIEIEVPAREPRHFSHIKRNHEPALKLETVLFSIYYPCDLDSKTLPRVPWLARPRLETCKGYSKFLRVPTFPVTAYFAITSMFTKLPAYRNAKLSSRTVGNPVPRDDQSNQTTPTPDEKDGNGDGNSKPRFPVIFFSHGLGGSRTISSTICGELASFGFVVVAMEHRDGSGARTFVNKTTQSPDLDNQEVDRAKRSPAGEEKEASKQRRRKRRAKVKPYYMVDYLFPKDNAQDTSPNNPRGVDFELRAAQIEMRLAEIDEAYYVLGLINSGDGGRVRERNLREKGDVGSSPRGLDGVDWRHWKGRLFLDHVTMMGHSFGGATTIEALRLEKHSWISQGVLLDPWGPATPESTEEKRLQKPVLSVGSEAFLHWKENYDRVVEICREARAARSLTWVTTIRGSTHLSQTDYAVLYPNWMSLLMKTIVNPRRAVYLTVHSALEFLKITLPPQHTRFNNSDAWAGEQLLSKADTDSRVVLDHRPSDRFVAARLKIPNELSLRLRGIFHWRRNNDPDVPTDAAGKPLIGLLNWGPGNELWVHLSPEPKEVEDYVKQNRGQVTWPPGCPATCVSAKHVL